jgi:hypothetical protein
MWSVALTKLIASGLLVGIDRNLIVSRPVDCHVPVAIGHGGDHERAASELRVPLPRFGADQAIFAERIAARPDDFRLIAAQQFVRARDVHGRLIAGGRHQLHLPGGERLDLFRGVILHDQPRVGDSSLA